MEIQDKQGVGGVFNNLLVKHAENAKSRAALRTALL